MIYGVVISLVFLAAILSLIVIRAVRVAWAMQAAAENFTCRPENLGVVLDRMLKTVEKENQWRDVEGMRHNVRLALGRLDRMRHDQSNANLRASKVQQ